MNRRLQWALHVVARFVVADGFSQALDAWVGDLDPAWQWTFPYGTSGGEAVTLMR